MLRWKCSEGTPLWQMSISGHRLRTEINNTRRISHTNQHKPRTQRRLTERSETLPVWYTDNHLLRVCIARRSAGTGEFWEGNRVENNELSTNLAEVGTDAISRERAINAVRNIIPDNRSIGICEELKQLPPIQPEIVRCKDCKHNPKYEWFGCPMSHLNEKQRPETAWCWKAERREVTT